VPDPAKDTTIQVSTLYLDAQDLAGLAFGNDLKWSATDLTICRKPLARNARVDGNFKALAAKGTLDGFGNFHRPIIINKTRVFASPFLRDFKDVAPCVALCSTLCSTLDRHFLPAGQAV
jgi:hypothetical protein